MISSWLRSTLLLVVLACWPLGRAWARSPFSIEVDQTIAIRLGGQTIARTHLPQGFDTPRLVRQQRGCTAVGRGHRLEWATFDDRLEYTLEFQLDPPVKSWSVLELPLSDQSVANVVHGTFERSPQTTEVRVASPDAAQSGDHQIEMVRFISVQGPEASYALDTQPAGAMGEDPGNTAGVMWAIVGRRVTAGLELRSALPGSRPARLRLKFIFYAPPQAFSDLHPFMLMNYRYAFEKVVKLDFTTAPMPKKSYDRRSVGTQPYRKDAGYGWLGDTAQLQLARTSLRQPLYGDYVGSHQPARFRIDIPSGHYYLTLNVGNADDPVGPMRVLVNGQPQIERLVLEPGRFKAEMRWITSSRDHLEIEFQALDGAAWQINALTASALGTLGEDFTLTRPWWHLPLPDTLPDN